MGTDKKVDLYILKKPKWAKELELLRETMTGTGLEETLKWGTPVYVDNKKNIVGLAAFKNYVGIWFFHGSLLKDSSKKLYNAQKVKTIAMRQWRFSSFDEIVDNLEIVESYVLEAIQNMRNGIVVKPAAKKPLVIPEELQQALDNNAGLKTIFDQLKLTPKREFCNFISNAKRAQTRQSRIKKIIPMILDGVGLGDKYRK